MVIEVSPTTSKFWPQCLSRLESTLRDEEHFHCFIAPLQVLETEQAITLFAPNHYIFSRIRESLLPEIEQSIRFCSPNPDIRIILKVGSAEDQSPRPDTPKTATPKPSNPGSNLTDQFTFQNFITGRSNEFAFAAAQQAALSPGQSYNPFVIFGSTGLGKTHLMQAIGHEVLKHQPNTKILYLHAEKFLSEMIKSLQRGSMDQFKTMLADADILMLDDIQFFANKERSQEELFHRFNEKLEDNKQVILTSDRYPKELNGFEDRLKSRFTWGLSVGIDPPELETRVAILMQKAQLLDCPLPQEVAFFVADKIQTNVRELEGILKRLVAHAAFTGADIDLPFTKSALKDLLTIHSRQVSIEQIQQAVARYYKLKVSDLLGKRRLQSVARPRQVAMYITKTLTSRSLPEIGRYFGNRDHTTVLHACQKIAKLLETDADLKVDFDNLVNVLTN
ncbi:MAG: chromosomal replication initiator protein DnaA [Pseudomonadota bacterium]|nr:chromosomal replication initiator protein DnaA [Pseudomonadota bacterium]